MCGEKLVLVVRLVRSAAYITRLVLENNVHSVREVNSENGESSVMGPCGLSLQRVIIRTVAHVVSYSMSLGSGGNRGVSGRV